MWAWGDNGSGQIGDGTTTDRSSPVQVTALTDVVAIAAGRSHSLAVKRDGTVWGWGANGSGQLGDNTRTPRSTPVQMVGVTQAIAAAAGANHSLILKAEGTVWTTGNNMYGQLGSGTSGGDSLAAAQVPNLTGVSRLAARSDTSAAIKMDGAIAGTLWTWGANTWGQLGDGTQAHRATAQPVLQDAVAVAVGENHLLAAFADYRVKGAGLNSSGQLGDGTLTTSTRPVLALNLSATHVAAGSTHSMARGTDESTWGWGTGFLPGLPINGGNPISIPQRTPGTGTDVIAVAAGDAHSVSARRDGSVWTWGNTVDGRLGRSTNGTDYEVPQPIPLFSLSDSSWMLGDPDGDGLATWRELDLGGDPTDPDSNGDGLLDGAAAASGKSLTNVDVDGDGVSNGAERLAGTDPFRADSDGDTYSDGIDAFPLDATRWQAPSPIPGDTTPPVITLTYPASAVPIPPI